jgi:uncharacterized membrane protein
VTDSVPGDPLAAWRPSPAAFVGIVLGAVLLIAYPFVIERAYERFGASLVAGVLLVVVAASYASGRHGVGQGALGLPFLARFRLAGVALVAVALVSADPRPLLLVPAGVQLYLTALFASSLRDATPVIERAARFLQPRAPDFIGPYCRVVTAIWSVLFALNAVVIVALVFAGGGAWRAFTGWGVYALLGALSAAEYFFRKAWFRSYGSGGVDRLWARLLPAQNTERGRRSLEYIRSQHDAMREAGLAAPREATPR